MKYLFTIILLITNSALLLAQKKKLTGVIKDSASLQPIAYASITNLNNNSTVLSNKNGYFTMDVTPNNILSFASINHYFDTLTINNENINDTLIIYLKAIANTLEEVTVYSGYNKYAADSTARRKEFLSKVGSKKLTTISNANSGAGMAINLDRFSRREKNKRRAFELFDKMEEEQYINFRYSPQIVNKYTGYSNDVLFNFMQQYRPTYTWLRTHPKEEDIKYFINDALKKSKQ